MIKNRLFISSIVLLITLIGLTLLLTPDSPKITGMAVGAGELEVIIHPEPVYPGENLSINIMPGTAGVYLEFGIYNSAHQRMDRLRVCYTPGYECYDPVNLTYSIPLDWTNGEYYLDIDDLGVHPDEKHYFNVSRRPYILLATLKDSYEVGESINLTESQHMLDEEEAYPLGGVGGEPDLPDFFNWRDRHGRNYITPVKNQNMSLCGSCWAFAANAVLEGVINIYFNNPDLDVDLSEQDLVSCFFGICSGSGEGVYNGYFQDPGVTIESCFPYTASDDDCSNKCSSWQDYVWKAASYVNITLSEPPLGEPLMADELSLRRIKQALIEYGPVRVPMLVYDDLLSYSGGIYYVSGDYVTDHVVTIVGYGVHDGQDYWIVKNSWGEDWGEDGYFRIYAYEGGIGTGDALGVIQPIPPEPIDRLCEDSDSDGYCNWGLGEKPDTGCPICNETIMDCDDSNASIFEGCGYLHEMVHNGVLNIVTVPEDVMIYVKDLGTGEYVYHGNSPLEIELNPGLREINASKLMYLENYSIVDITERSRTDLLITLLPPSVIQNNEITSLTGNVKMILQRDDAGSWIDEQVVVDKQLTVLSDDFIRLDLEWNPNNVTAESVGRYRVYAEFDYGTDTINASWDFNVTVPCTDSDGIVNYLTKGNCTDSEGTYFDRCMFTNGATDWSCQNDSCVEWSISSCSVFYNGEYSCIDGACININDIDNDGILNNVDNCLEVSNPLQNDSDGDGYGNACDCDFNNNYVCGIGDLWILLACFLDENLTPQTPYCRDKGVDMSGDGIFCAHINCSVGHDDWILFDQLFPQPALWNQTPYPQTIPGPSGYPDTDGDKVIDFYDNCINRSNTNQRDTNLDGYGNVCDMNLDNDNDVDNADFQIWRPSYLAPVNESNEDSDFNGDGIIDVNDFWFFYGPNGYFKPVGPSGHDCAGVSTPCPP